MKTMRLVERLGDNLLGLLVPRLSAAAEPCECRTSGACKYPVCYCEGTATIWCYYRACRCNGCHWYCASNCYLDPACI
jgi:hypothetical protein